MNLSSLYIPELFNFYLWLGFLSLDTGNLTFYSGWSDFNKPALKSTSLTIQANIPMHPLSRQLKKVIRHCKAYSCSTPVPTLILVLLGYRLLA